MSYEIDKSYIQRVEYIISRRTLPQLDEVRCGESVHRSVCS
jgi:hypothetical protein